MGYFIRGAKFPVFSSRRGKDPLSSSESLRVSLLDGGWDGDRRPVVPKGFVAVYVGEEMRRFVIPTSYLCLPPIRPLMERVAEEFGFEQEGGLQIPCDEQTFEGILKVLEETTLRMKKKEKKLMFR